VSLLSRAARLRVAVRRPRAAGKRSPRYLQALIAAWYSLSASLSLFNKHLLGRGRGHFPAPLFALCWQLCVQVCMNEALLRGPYHALRPAPLERESWTRDVLPVGLTTGADVGCSNLSLIYITLSFYTMCKSVSPIFLLFFALSMGLERPSWLLAASVVCIVAGVACAVAGEAAFNATGFVLVMLAAALGGLRWALTQRLMARHADRGLGHPLALASLLFPVMAALTGAASLATESLWRTLPASPFFDSAAHGCETLLLISLSAPIAFAMTCSEFALMHSTSAMTLSVAGTVKEAAMVAIFAAVDGDALGPLNLLGLLLVVLGVGCYHVARSGGHAPAAARARLAGEAGAGEGEGDVALALRAEEGATAVQHRGLTRATSPRALARPPSYDSILRDMLPDKTR